MKIVSANIGTVANAIIMNNFRFRLRPHRTYQRGYDMADTDYHMGFNNAKTLLGSPMIPALMKMSIQHPGKLFKKFFIANNMEFESRAVFNIETNVITSNLPCPYWRFHTTKYICPCCINIPGFIIDAALFLHLTQPYAKPVLILIIRIGKVNNNIIVDDSTKIFRKKLNTRKKTVSKMC